MRVDGQGPSPRDFHRAIERKNLLVAEMTAREMGFVGLSEALDLVCLVAEKKPDRLDAFGKRWLVRLIDERPLTLAELDVVLTALRALPSRRAAEALHGFL